MKGFSASTKVEVIKDYNQDAFTPALLEAGNQSLKVDIDSMWLDNVILNEVLAGTAMDIKLRGATGGDLTFTNCILSLGSSTRDQQFRSLAAISAWGK